MSFLCSDWHVLGWCRCRWHMDHGHKCCSVNSLVPLSSHVVSSLRVCVHLSTRWPSHSASIVTHSESVVLSFPSSPQLQPDGKRMRESGRWEKNEMKCCWWWWRLHQNEWFEVFVSWMGCRCYVSNMSLIAYNHRRQNTVNTSASQSSDSHRIHCTDDLIGQRGECMRTNVWSVELRDPLLDIICMATWQTTPGKAGTGRSANLFAVFSMFTFNCIKIDKSID